MPTLPFLLPAGDVSAAVPSAPASDEATNLVALASAQPPLRLAQRDDTSGLVAPTPRVAGLGTGGQGANSTQTASPRLNVGPNRYT